MVPLVIFTDLDGTLIDADTYSTETVAPLVADLKERGIPICVCSSKTRREIEVYRSRLGIDDPFISENGGAVFLENEVLELGIPYARLTEALRQARSDLGIPIRGFHQLSAEELSANSGLQPDEAVLALCREYDEPFWVEDDGARIELLREWVERQGLRMTRGSRYYHLMGNNDKGMAVELLADRLRRKTPEIRTVGLGDSANDIPMLRRADIPILVRLSNGRYDEEVRAAVFNLRLTAGIGPAGWVEGVTAILNRSD